MKILKVKLYLLSVISLVIISCDKNEYIDPSTAESNLKYSFFVAGHTYGNPMSYQFGLHPPFVNTISFINNYPLISFGVFTGDVVPIPTQEYWDSAISDIDKLHMPIHIAAGNHDRGIIFENIFKNYYYSFKNENDLFIILSPVNWNIDGTQKDFLIETIDSNSSAVNNIFIFCHELIWWSPENIFRNVKINYLPHYPGSTNYWSEINPILDSLPNNVVLFAGDLGATASVSPYMYYKYGNITLIGSGMGGGEQDNIIIVEINKQDELKYRLLGINNIMPYEMADLEEYELP